MPEPRPTVTGAAAAATAVRTWSLVTVSVYLKPVAAVPEKLYVLPPIEMLAAEVDASPAANRLAAVAAGGAPALLVVRLPPDR
ncbi:hypothetical protein D9M72_571300 [compost metagenome]